MATAIIPQNQPVLNGKNIRIEDILVPVGRRKLQDLNPLIESIREVGLLNPITVSKSKDNGKSFCLVAGYHRLEACRRIGYKEIAAVVIELSAIDTELAEIDENLIRNELTVLERSEVLMRRKELYEAKYPGTKHGGDRGNQYTGGKCQNLAFDSFTKDTAQKTGKGESTVRQEVQIAKNLDPEVKEALRDTPVADNKTKLLKLSRMKPEEQRRAAPHVRNNSGVNEWYTPPEYLESARVVLGEIDLDPASSAVANCNVKARRFFSIEDDGLSQVWKADSLWMNPPYSSDLVSRFAAKLAEHVKSGEINQAIVLVNNATETGWFNILIKLASAVIFPKNRIKYLNEHGNVIGTPLQGQAVIYYGKNYKKFIQEFSKYGWSALVYKNGS